MGFTKVADDKASTLLGTSLDLFDGICDVHCEAEGDADKTEIFKEAISKMKSLISDRTSNIKLFKKKMLEHKKDLLGEDAAIHFLYCNVHFLIVKMVEGNVEETSEFKLGRDGQAMFKGWEYDETSTFRLLITAADVFGPRGDEKSGSREEWLAIVIS